MALSSPYIRGAAGRRGDVKTLPHNETKGHPIKHTHNCKQMSTNTQTQGSLFYYYNPLSVGDSFYFPTRKKNMVKLCIHLCVCSVFTHLGFPRPHRDELCMCHLIPAECQVDLSCSRDNIKAGINLNGWATHHRVATAKWKRQACNRSLLFICRGPSYSSNRIIPS